MTELVRRGKLGPETLPAIGLLALILIAAILSALVDRIGGIQSLFIYALSAFILAALSVALLRPTTMGLKRWFHRFQLRRYSLPGVDALQRQLAVSTQEDLPSHRAMLMLEVRSLLLELLSHHFATRQRSPRALMSHPQVVSFLSEHADLMAFLNDAERLARDPELFLEGWSGAYQFDFSNRLSEVITSIGEAFGGV